MKTSKYVLVGALLLSLAAPVSAQDASYQDMLTPINSALKDAASSTSKTTLDLIKKYEKTFKKDPKALVALGNTMLNNKKFDEAADLANKAIARDKSYGDAYVLLGDIAALKDDGGNAAMWFQQAMTMDPKNPAGYMSYASVYRKVDPEGAAAALEKLHQVRPDYPIHAEAAHTYYAGNKYDKALENYDKVGKEKLDEYKLIEYAVSAYMENKKDQSLDLAKYGISKFPKDATFLKIALWNTDDLQKYDEAVNYAQTIMATDSIDKTQRDFIYYGQALTGLKRFDEAVVQYNKALQLKPDDPKPLQYISDAYNAKGDQDKALEYSEKYMSANPDAAPSDYAKLATVYLDMAVKKEGTAKDSTYNKAFGIYEKIGRKFPSIESWADLQAGFQASKAGYDDKAANYFKKVISLLENKENRDKDETNYLKSAYSNLGYYYWGTKNDLDTAKPYYEKLIKLDPNDKNAKAALNITEDNAGENTTTDATSTTEPNK